MCDTPPHTGTGRNEITMMPKAPATPKRRPSVLRRWPGTVAVLARCRVIRRRVMPAVVATAVVSAGMMSPLPAQAAASHNPFGSVGSLGFVNGAVVLSGWAIDPDANVAVRIEVHVDGRLTGALSA